MFSIRNPKRLASVASAGILAAILMGCQSVHVSDQSRSPYEEHLDTTPITTDGAMARRQWDVTAARYAQDAVVTQPNYEPLQLDRLAYEGNAILEPVFFIGNTFYLPVGLVLTPPWTWQVNKSLKLPEGYTLMPALPPGAEPIPTY
jgi:hypothetical protein